MKKLFFLVFLVFLHSCSNHKSLLSVFEQMENITHISVVQPSISRWPYALALYDTLLVWLDPYDDKHLSLFDVQNNKLLHRFGSIGVGPGEMTMWPKGRKYQHDYYHIFDNNQKQILVFPIESVVKDSLFRPIDIYNFRANTGLANVIQVNNNLFLGINNNSDSIYALLDNSGRTIFTGFSYPEDGINTSPFVKYIAYQGNFHQNPDNPYLLAHIGTSGAVVDILKIEHKKIIRKKRMNFVLPKYKPVNINGMSGALLDDESIIGSISTYVTSDFIYILYADKPEVEKRCSDIILVFDWMGQPIKYYKSDVDLFQICVSDDNKTIYGVIMNPEVELVKFEL